MHISSEREDLIKELIGPKRVREISLVYLPNHVQKRILVQLVPVIQQSIPKKMLDAKGIEQIPTGVKV